MILCDADAIGEIAVESIYVLSYDEGVPSLLLKLLSLIMKTIMSLIRCIVFRIFYFYSRMYVTNLQKINKVFHSYLL